MKKSPKKNGNNFGCKCTKCEDFRERNMQLVQAYESDPVNSPSHYTFGGMETIDVLKAKMTPEEFRGFLRGNVLKYVMRAEEKGNARQDYEKAQWYLNRLVREMIDPVAESHTAAEGIAAITSDGTVMQIDHYTFPKS